MGGIWPSLTPSHTSCTAHTSRTASIAYKDTTRIHQTAHTSHTPLTSQTSNLKLFTRPDERKIETAENNFLFVNTYHSADGQRFFYF